MGGRRAWRRRLPEEGPEGRQEARLGRRRTWPDLFGLFPGHVGLFGLVNKPVLFWLPPLSSMAADHLFISIKGYEFSGADVGSPAPFSSRGLLYETGSLSLDLGEGGLFWAGAAGRPAALPGSQDHPPPPPLHSRASGAALPAARCAFSAVRLPSLAVALGNLHMC